MAWYKLWRTERLIKAQGRVSKELKYYGNLLAALREEIIHLAGRGQIETGAYKSRVNKQKIWTKRKENLQEELNRINNELK